MIGSGPAGSIAGAYLAKGGLKTVVFEAAQVVGGPKYGAYTLNGHHIDHCCHIPIWHMPYNGGGGWWPKAAAETGAVIGMQVLPNTGVCLRGKITPTPYCFNGATMADYIKRFSPEPLPEASLKELERTFDEVLAMPEEVLWSAEMENMSFKTWVDAVTDDALVKRLLAVFTAIIFVVPVDYVLEVSTVTSVVGGVLQAFMGGCANLSMIVGDGADGLPKGFCGVVTKHGGKVLTNHPVRKVIIDGGRARGVIVQNELGGEDVYEARHVIIASNYQSIRPLLGDELLPQNIKDALARFDGVHHTTSVDVHFLLKSKFVKMAWGQVIVLSDDMDYRGAILVPSFFEPTLSPPEKQFIMAERFFKTSEYKPRSNEEWIEEHGAMVEQAFPGFRNEVEATSVVVVSPTIQFSFVPGEKLPLQFPGISGLYIAGDCTMSPGIATERSASSAMTVAKTILRREGKGFLI